MSFMNNVMNVILKHSNLKDIQNEKLDNGTDRLMLRNPKSKQLKKLQLKNSIFENRTISHISKPEDSINCDVIYFHGGCYALQMQAGHWAITTYIARETGANVFVVDYPLIPEHKGKEAIEYAFSYYKYHLKNNINPIIIIGDSAGAGLATSLCMMIRENKIKPPIQLILLSPYLDTLCTDSRQLDYQSKDFFLTVKGLTRAGKTYIDNLDAHDYRVNPIQGSFKNLPPIIIFTSDRDILHVDSIRLIKILKDSKIEYKLYEEKNVMHDWIIIDQLPEAKKAREKLKEYILTITNTVSDK